MLIGSFPRFRAIGNATTLQATRLKATLTVPPILGW